MSPERVGEEDPRFSGEAWDYFVLELRKKNPETAKVYTRYLKRFLEDNNYTAEEFYNHVKETLSADDKRKIRLLEDELHRYYSSLVADKGLHINTVKNYEKSVVVFLKSNYLQLPFSTKINGSVKAQHMNQFTSNGKDKAEVSEIKTLLMYQGEPRNVAAILFARDSGLRISDVVNLKIRDIQPIIDDPSLEWFTFEITPIKNLRMDTPLPANPVIGPESIEALRIWLRHREEKYGLDNSDHEAYVFGAVYNRGKTRIGDKITPNSLSNMVKLTREKGGMEKAISPHSLRKTHSTNLAGAGVPERWVNIMQGKKGQGTQGAYQRPNKDELLDVYKKAYHSLSLGGAEGVEVEALKQHVQQQRDELEEVKLKQEHYEGMFNMLIAGLTGGVGTRGIDPNDVIRIMRTHPREQWAEEFNKVRHLDPDRYIKEAIKEAKKP